MQNLYLSLKWLHIVAIISWMAGILYQYRLLIYLAERGHSPESHELLSMMARKLYKVITFPAMVVSFLLGFGVLGTVPTYASTGWFGIKFLCVLLLAGSTLYAGWLVRKFSENAANLPTGKQLRWLNEVPTILMIIIVAMVVFKPF